MAYSHDHHDGQSHTHNHVHEAAEEGHGHDHAAAEDVSFTGGLQEQRYSQAKERARLEQTNLAEAKANQRKLRLATAFVVVFFVVEVVGGLWAQSLAIISDAAHLLTDISGFLLAMLANEFASRPPCDKLTYGPARAEVLSALFSTVTILVLSLILVYSAIVRLVEFSQGRGEEIDGKMMSFIAFLGLLVNLALLGIFGHELGGHDHSHGHGHSHEGDDDHDHGDHDHGDHDHGDHDHDHDHGNGNGIGGHRHDHDEEDGLAASMSMSGKIGGVGERAPLVNGASSSSSSSSAVGAGARLPLSGTVDISSSSSSSSRGGGGGSFAGDGGGKDQYGSLAVGDGGGAAAAAAVGFPELGAGAEAPREVKLKKEKNINMEAAVLHAVTDLVQSAGVLLAGLLIWYDPRWKWADPIATLFFVGLVMNSTRWLLQRAFNVLLEGVPDTMDYDQLRKRLSGIEGVTDVHCLHVWSLTLGRTVMTAHIKATDPERALASAHEICESMGVAHSTIQVQVDKCLPESSTQPPCVSAVCCD